MKVLIYTDGAAKGNPGRGGYGAVLISGNLRKEISQGFRLTTNNRMELLAVIVALESVKKADSVVVYSDSKYVVDAINKRWVFSWEKKNFNKKKNPDLWVRFLKVFRSLSVSFVWVKGHSNDRENERCDFLAVQAAESGSLLVDRWYEKTAEGGGLSLF